MPLFSSSSPFDKLVEKATNESNTSEDWQSVLDCCDYINSSQSRCVDCFRSIMKRILHNHSNVALQSLILLDACVSNCGKKFHLEVASREFEMESRKLLAKGNPKVLEKFKILLKKWTENEFKSDPQLALIPSYYNRLKSEGVDFTYHDPMKPIIPKDPNVVTSDQEEEDIIKAIEASLKETKGNPQSSNYNNYSNSHNQSTSSATASSTTSAMYPDISSSALNIGNFGTDFGNNRTTSGPSTSTVSQTNPKVKEPFKVRALYDFEAAEDNELTFKAGEMILVTDGSDENWWSGSNQRGQGLFPANFVSKDLDVRVEEAGTSRNVQFDDKVKVKYLEDEVTKIDVEKIDKLLHLIHEADPTGQTPDSEELLLLEDHCSKMSKLIDHELERLDRKNVSLNTANRQLSEAMRMYLYLNI